MDTLFDTSEFFKKERPTKPTKEQLNSFYETMANEAIKNQYTESDKEDIIEDLKKLYPFNDSGFEMAKDLDRYSIAEYEIDSEFIEWLEGLDYRFRKVKEINIKEWVRCHNIKPAFEKGQKLIIDKFLCYKKEKGKIVYVNGFYEELGNYIIDEDPNREGGTILNYELVEKCCSKIE